MLRASQAVRWKLSGGGLVDAEELTLASISADRVRLCLYDDASPLQPLVALGVAAPDACGERACWRAVGSPTRPEALRYRNKSGAPDGITDVRLQAHRGALGAVVKGRGPALALPPLGVGLPLRVQLVVGDPAHPRCWQSVFTTALRNDTTMVRATQQP